MGQIIEFMRPDGETAPGYLASGTDAETAPGIVIIEEWWGLTADVMRIADEYAALGYRALVPDLFRGRTAAIGDEANHLLEGLDFHDAYSQDARGALAHLKQNGKKAGITGYCIGASIAFLAAMHLKEPNAAVVFYGFPSSEEGDPATIEIPLQCHFARGDAFFTPARAVQIEARMKEGKVPCEVYWYDAKHGFCNPNQAGNSGLGHYDAKAAHEAWERTVRFWKNTLHE
jgi:carboxymethylenebutenolidase